MRGVPLTRIASQSDLSPQAGRGKKEKAGIAPGLYYSVLERFRAKWIPVRVKKTRQNKNLELRF